MNTKSNWPEPDFTLEQLREQRDALTKAGKQAKQALDLLYEVATETRKYGIITDADFRWNIAESINITAETIQSLRNEWLAVQHHIARLSTPEPGF